MWEHVVAGEVYGVLMGVVLLLVVTQAVDPPPRFELQTTLCHGKCVEDCQTFETPLGACYNAQQLFPNNPSWSAYDLLDVIPAHVATVPSIHRDDDPDEFFYRYIFDSNDASCRGTVTDSFVLPTDICVGPFGEPRPWGNFSLRSIFSDTRREDNTVRRHVRRLSHLYHSLESVEPRNTRVK